MQKKRNGAATPGRQLFEDALALFQEGKTDELIEKYYRFDAILVIPGRIIQGHKALSIHFRALARVLSSFELLSLDSFTETNDAILIEKTITTGAGGTKVYDAFVYEDLKITHHLTGVR